MIVKTLSPVKLEKLTQAVIEASGEVYGAHLDFATAQSDFDRCLITALELRRLKGIRDAADAAYVSAVRDLDDYLRDTAMRLKAQAKLDAGA